MALLRSSYTVLSPRRVQGATSYTVTAHGMLKVVQFRTTKLPLALVELARQSYGVFVPSNKAHDMMGPTYVCEWDLVSGPAFCRVRREWLSPGMEPRLQQTVQDFARWVQTGHSNPASAFGLMGSKRFFASAWIHRPEVTQSSALLDEYIQTLDELALKLPERFHSKLDEVLQGVPLLFRAEYPVVVQHHDLLENNIHVDEATGKITGIVDWQDAMIAPFGVSLSGLETVLGVQTRSTWYFHPNHLELRGLFWHKLYETTGEIYQVDRETIEIARLFGLFELHGPEENAAAWLDVLLSC